MNRHSYDVKWGTWGPKKAHRMAAKKWCLSSDAQFRAVAPGGLAYFKPVEGGDLWRSPFGWPHFACAMDLGSDGNCAFHALERHYGLNCDQHKDQSHGVDRDWDLML